MISPNDKELMFRCDKDYIIGCPTLDKFTANTTPDEWYTDNIWKVLDMGLFSCRQFTHQIWLIISFFFLLNSALEINFFSSKADSFSNRSSKSEISDFVRVWGSSFATILASSISRSLKNFFPKGLNGFNLTCFLGGPLPDSLKKFWSDKKHCSRGRDLF